VSIIIKLASFITLLFCIAVLVISIYPGALNSLLFPLSLALIIGMPMLVIIGIMVFGILTREGKWKSIQIPWRGVALIAGMLLVLYILIKFYIPRRLAFIASRSAFEQIRVQIPVAKAGKMRLDRQLGFYTVDEYAADSRGGVYFRVYSGGNGIGIDVTSYGFVYQPNPEGSPFGSADYQVFYLSENWYWFRVSDDW
jgi:hypothetical protein